MIAVRLLTEVWKGPGAIQLWQRALVLLWLCCCGGFWLTWLLIYDREMMCGEMGDANTGPGTAHDVLFGVQLHVWEALKVDLKGGNMQPM